MLIYVENSENSQRSQLATLCLSSFFISFEYKNECQSRKLCELPTLVWAAVLVFCCTLTPTVIVALLCMSVLKKNLR